MTQLDLFQPKVCTPETIGDCCGYWPNVCKLADEIEGKPTSQATSFDDLVLISVPAGRTTHICWSCMKVKEVMYSSETKTIYQLWDCCKELSTEVVHTPVDEIRHAL